MFATLEFDRNWQNFHAESFRIRDTNVYNSGSTISNQQNKSVAFVSTYMMDNRINVPSIETCNLLRSADLAEEEEGKIAIDSDTTWQRL